MLLVIDFLDVGSIPTVSTFTINQSTKIDQYFINNAIEQGLRWAKKSPDQIRLVGPDGKQLGVFNLEQALNKAREEGLDLVLITAKANPPVCRIIEAGKFLYQKKKEKKKADSVESKKLKIKFNTSEHDMETRVNQAKKFLAKGNRIQVIMMLRGRENAFRPQAEDKMKHFLVMIESACPVKIENQTSRKSKMIQYEVSPSSPKKHES